jgi:hypothetical protein
MDMNAFRWGVKSAADAPGMPNRTHQAPSALALFGPLGNRPKSKLTATPIVVSDDIQGEVTGIDAKPRPRAAPEPMGMQLARADLAPDRLRRQADQFASLGRSSAPAVLDASTALGAS